MEAIFICIYIYGWRRLSPPAVDVDTDEDRFHEKGEAFNRKSETEDAAEGGGEAQPQEAHLEAEDRPRYDPSRKQGRHHPRPTLHKGPIELIAGAKVEPLD